MTDSTSGLRNLDAVTGADLQSITFATSKGFGRGYDQHEVDSFVVRCAQAVDRLRARIDEVTARHESQVAELQERIERDSRSNEVAQAMSVLITAQQTADKTVAQADEYSAKVMAEARELYEDTRKNAATLEQETEDKARHVYEEALSRAETIEREATEQVAQLTLTAHTAQQELDQQTTYLRTLRDTSRVQIQSFLEGLLDHVADEYGKAHPIAAEAATAAASSARKAKRAGRTGAKSAVKGAAAGKSTIKVAGLAPVRRGGPATATAFPTQQEPVYDDGYDGEFGNAYQDR
ncbi:MAG TPA: DivIVA domain-containing protein [Nakamurella sp.]